MNRRLAALGAMVAILTATACGGAGGVNPPATGAGAPYGGNSAPANFDWGKEGMQGAVLIGPANLGHMQVTAVVKQQNAAGLVQYAQQAGNPSSPLYRHFLTPQDIGQQFGATQKDYQTAASYFVSQGLNVAGWPQRLSLSVAGPQAAMERAFGTRFGLYEKDGQQFTAPMTPPHLAAAIPLTAVSNLVAYHVAHRYLIVAPPRANANDNIGYSPQQVRNAFDYTGAYAKGYTGSGITVGIIGTGPINVSRSDLCADKDLASYRSLYNDVNVGTVCEKDVTPSGVAAGLAASGIPTAAPAPTPSPNSTPKPNPGVSPTSMFPFSGDFQTPPPITSAGCGTPISSTTAPRTPGCNPEDAEAQLDTQQIAALAPGAAVDFYLAYNASDCYVYFPNNCAAPAKAPASPGPGNGYPTLGILEADPEIQQAIADNQADVLSISIGEGETDNIGSGYNQNGVGYEPEEYAALAAEGVAVFVASGDSGVLECSSSTPCPSYPSGDVNVTSVGGVNAPINEFGQLSANITAWGNTNGGNGGATAANWSGSGGGTSTIFAAPAWQQSAIGASKRKQPDVSMIGDPFTGVTVFINTGLTGSGNLPSDSPIAIGGTSVATPQMAAMWALVLSACNATPACRTGPSSHPYRLGNAAPLLYGIYSERQTGQPAPQALPYPNVFYDVVYGENAMPNSGGGYVQGAKAGPGYDLVTGIGVPFAGHLIQAITGQTVP